MCRLTAGGYGVTLGRPRRCGGTVAGADPDLWGMRSAKNEPQSIALRAKLCATHPGVGQLAEKLSTQ